MKLLPCFHKTAKNGNKNPCTLKQLWTQYEVLYINIQGNVVVKLILFLNQLYQV